ncbi:MAG: transposase family protein [Arthrobacter sp.]|nr:transposase family protein [Arthrobacter sp.]
MVAAEHRSRHRCGIGGPDGALVFVPLAGGGIPQGPEDGLPVRARPTAHRLLALLGFLALVAVRLLQVRDEARQRPLTPAVEIVPVLLVQLVALHFNLEAAGMTIHTFWRCVAKVGGFPGRKGDGDPGWLTLWQGWSEVLQWYRGALLMKAMARCG